MESMVSKFFLISFGLLAIAAPLGAETVDLHRAEKLALENNLGLKAEAFQVQASEATVQSSYGLYDSTAGLTLVLG